MSYKSKIQREPYAFSPTTKDEIYLRNLGICEVCKKKPIEEIHHIVAIFEVIRWNKDNPSDTLAPTLISSLANALGVCEECHRMVHKKQSPVEDRVEHLRTKTGFQPQLDLFR